MYQKKIQLDTTGWARWFTGNCAKSLIWPNEQTNMQNPESVRENEMHKLLWDFKIQMGYLISVRRLHQVIVNKKMRTYRIVDFPVPADSRLKLKESEKRDKFLDLARELLNMKVMVIPIVVGALWTFPKDWKSWK